MVYFHNPNKKIFLLTSPILSSHDQNLIQEIEDVEERIKFQSTQLETLIKDAVNDVSYPNLSNIFKWLVANDRLEIKFAIPKHTHNSRDFHDKLGIFEFDEGIKISFEGSANETLNGIKYNSERIPIYRSWVKEEVNKLQEVIEDFEYDWNQSNDGLIIKDIPDALKDEIFKKAPNEIEDEIKEIIEKQAEIKKIDEYVDPFLIINDKKYNFQIGIRKNFIEKKCGYLELATERGKLV